MTILKDTWGLQEMLSFTMSLTRYSGNSATRKTRNDIEATLERSGPNGNKGVPFQITYFSDATDGFAVRTRARGAHEKFAKDEVFRQAVQWLHKYIKGNEKKSPRPRQMVKHDG